MRQQLESESMLDVGQSGHGLDLLIKIALIVCFRSSEKWAVFSDLKVSVKSTLNYLA